MCVNTFEIPIPTVPFFGSKCLEKFELERDNVSQFVHFLFSRVKITSSKICVHLTERIKTITVMGRVVLSMPLMLRIQFNAFGQQFRVTNTLRYGYVNSNRFARF